MSALSQDSRTATDRVALAYQSDVHPAARPLLDAIAQLYGYQPRDRADLAQLLKSLGGDSTGATNVVSEIGDLVKDLVQHPVMGDLPRSERALAVEQATEYGEIVLQGDGEDLMNQVIHVVEGHTVPATGARSRAARALGGGR
jgi:hypothetical protein